MEIGRYLSGETVVVRLIIAIEGMGCKECREEHTVRSQKGVCLKKEGLVIVLTI